MKYSPYSHSLDVDIFPPKRPRKQTPLWKWILAIGFCLFFVYRSTLPELRLQSSPPPEFIDATPHGRRDSRLSDKDKRIAWAYWNVAVHSIQAKYPPKKSLPLAPPPEFRIDSSWETVSGNLDADRDFYWRRLRKLWSQQDTWRVTYEWSTNWVTILLGKAGQFAEQELEQFKQSIRDLRYELGQTNIS